MTMLNDELCWTKNSELFDEHFWWTEKMFWKFFLNFNFFRFVIFSDRTYTIKVTCNGVSDAREVGNQQKY